MIPKKPAPDFVPECKPVFGKDYAQAKKIDFDPIQSNRIKV
jgi:hypothetical protein